MRGSDAASWNKKWDCFVTRGFHLRRYILERHSPLETKESRNIFENGVARLESENNLKSSWPEPAVIRFALSFPGMARRLARYAGGNKVDWTDCGGIKGFDVGEDFCIGVVFSDYVLTEGIYFAETDVPVFLLPRPSGCEGEPALAAEEIEMAHVIEAEGF